jgi:hypothetical protein
MGAGWSAACAEPPGIDDLRDECVRAPLAYLEAPVPHVKACCGWDASRTSQRYAGICVGCAGYCRKCQGLPSVRFLRHGTRDSSGWDGCGAEPCVKHIAPQAPPIPSGAWGRPERGRVHSQEGAADQARGGIGCKPVSPAQRGRRRRGLRPRRKRARLQVPPGVRERARHHV